MPYFVKFVPYNESTLSALLNETIKFSTVYELNDFNELGYLATNSAPYGEDFNTNIEAVIKEKFNNIDFRVNLYNNAVKSGAYKTEYLNAFKNKLNDYYSGNTKIFENDYQFIERCLAFESVGIFCVSDLNVFCDDSAQLMFAHYGSNLKGLALIYEMISEPSLNYHSCIYPPYDIKKELQNNLCLAEMKPSSGGFCGRLFKWVKNDYSDIEDFRKKSKKWEYEKEYRLFAKPGIKNAKDHNIALKGILYTSRFPQHDVETLKSINKNIYEGKLIIQAIYPSASHYKFLVDGGNLEDRCIIDLISALDSKKLS